MHRFYFTFKNINKIAVQCMQILPDPTLRRLPLCQPKKKKSKDSHNNSYSYAKLQTLELAHK